MQPARKSWLQLAPLALVMLLFVAAPLVFVVVVSFFRSNGFNTIPGFTLENYAVLLGSSLTLSLYLKMIKYAAMTWVI